MTQDQEIRTDQDTKLNNRFFFGCLYRMCLLLALIYLSCTDLSSLFFNVSIFQQFLPSSSVAHSIISVHAYPSVVLPHLQLSLFHSTTWCSSMYRSLRVSDSVSLSSNTCCRRSASLLSDDAESSPPSILPFHPTLPVFLSSLSSHTCVRLTDCFYSKASPDADFSLSSALPADVSCLFAFHLHLHLPSFLLIRL